MKKLLTVLSIFLSVISVAQRAVAQIDTSELHLLEYQFSTGAAPTRLLTTSYKGTPYDFALNPAPDTVPIKLGKTFKSVPVSDSTGKELLRITNNDTAVIGAVKYLKIGDKIFFVDELKNNEIVGLPIQYWAAVLVMLRNATGAPYKPEEMIAIINAIAQQLPQPKR